MARIPAGIVIRSQCWIDGSLFAGEHIFHALRAHPPFRDEPVRGQPGMERTGRAPVKIGEVVPHDGAEPLDVEVRVLEFQPVKKVHSMRLMPRSEGVFALVLQQPPLPVLMSSSTPTM